MANITTQTIRVDLSTDKVIPSAFTHQNDTARTLEFSMYNKGMPYTMTGNTVKFAYKSPIVDGAYTVITGAGMESGTVSGNKVTVTLPSTYTAISGVGMLTMIITPTSGTVRPVNIRLVVQKSADGDDSVAGASDFPNSLETIASAWFDENLSQTIDEIVGTSFMKEIPLEFTEGGYIDTQTGNVVEYSSWKYTDYIDISNLSHGYFVGVTASGSPSGYKMFYDEDKNVIPNWEFRLENTLTNVGVPINGKYMRLSCKSSDTLRVFDVADAYESDKVFNKWYWYSNTAYQTKRIPVSGSKYNLVVPDGYEVSVEFYRENDTVIRFTNYGGSMEIYLPDFCSSVCLYVRATSGARLTPQDENYYKVLFYPKEKFERFDYFKLMTFNVGMWYNGVTTLPDDMIAQRKIDYFKMWGETNPDVICLQEATDTIGTTNTVHYGSFVAWKFPFSGHYKNLKNRSKTVMTNPVQRTFASGSNRACYSFDVQIGDAIVTIINAHLGIEASTTGKRQQDLQEIKQWMDACDYAILCGDLNTYDMTEITGLFDSENYNIANGGDFGLFASWPHSDATWPNESIDNIVCTKNISIQNVKLVDCDLSDHKPLIAELSVYY